MFVYKAFRKSTPAEAISKQTKKDGEIMATFAELITGLMVEQRHSCVSLSKALQNEVKARMLALYKNGESVPAADKARLIFGELGYECSEEELKQILEESKEAAKSIRQTKAQKLYSRGINFRMELYDGLLDVDELDAETFTFMIEDRSKEIFTYGDGKEYVPDGTGSFNNYIEYLIVKDLKERNNGGME